MFLISVVTWDELCSVNTQLITAGTATDILKRDVLQTNVMKCKNCILLTETRCAVQFSSSITVLPEVLK